MVLAAASLSLIALTSAVAAGSISTLRPSLGGLAGAVGAAGGCCCCASASGALIASDAARTEATIEAFIRILPFERNDQDFLPPVQSCRCDFCAGSSPTRRCHSVVA